MSTTRTPASGDDARAVVVLGAHRSGTSALMRLCNLLGVDLGPRLVPPAPGNEAGFWEHLDIVCLHDELLEALGSWWDDPRPLPDRWWEGAAAAACRERILSVLRRDFADVALWGIKDPRACRLMPMWREILDEMPCRAVFVHVVRNPVDVAASLARRDRTAGLKAELLWLSHLFEAERHTRDAPRAFLTYEGLLADWQESIERVRRAGGLEWPKAPASITHEVGAFLRPERRHHAAASTSPARATPASRLAADAYALVDASARDGPADRGAGMAGLERGYAALLDAVDDATWRLLDELAGAHRGTRERQREVERRDRWLVDRDETIARLSESLADVHAKLEEATARADRLAREVAARDAAIAQRDARMAEILASTSWRITRPLRWLGERLHRLRGARRRSPPSNHRG